MMIFEHEIPDGSKLYFGKNAKLKRELEASLSGLLSQEGYEEIITPMFSYYQTQSIQDTTKLITIHDESNNQIALRADSTLDAVRIITKRLGKTTSHKKWFYIQSVFSYPSTESNQIGCEWIDHNNPYDIIVLAIKALDSLKIKPIIQISNINIPKLIAKYLSIDEQIFQNNHIHTLFDFKLDWLDALIKTNSVQDLHQAQSLIPQFLEAEVKKLYNLCAMVSYENLVVAPLYKSSLKYYSDAYFRIFDGNLTLAKGGQYEYINKQNEALKSLGFALYTDNLLKFLKGKA